MSVDESRRPIASRAVWLGSELASQTSWVHVLTPQEIDEIHAAVRAARNAGKTVATITRDDFPLPTFAETVRAWARELDTGRGFVLVRGLPVAALGADDAALAYYGLGLHMGTPVPQNKAGDLLGHVRDRGVPRTGPHVRRYATREAQDFHADGSDVVGLLCLQRARSGGLSRIVSSAAIYNEMLRRRPDLVDVLHAPIHFDRNDEQGPGEPPAFALPVFYAHGGKLRTFYIGWYIRDAERHPDVPRLTREQLEAMELLESIAHDPRFYFDMDFQVGDIQLLKNATILHARTEYEDHDEPERKRHLLRLWLTAHDFSSVEEEGIR